MLLTSDTHSQLLYARATAGQQTASATAHVTNVSGKRSTDMHVTCHGQHMLERMCEYFNIDDYT